MKKTLLYLEDNGFLLKRTVMFLEEDGYEVIRCSRIDLAIDALRDNKDKIDCIITDLNMDDQWLGSYQIESCGGLLSGWVWLRRFVYTEEKYRTIPCIIYSGFISELIKYLTDRNELCLLDKFNVTCIQKRGYNALYDKLRDILHD